MNRLTIFLLLVTAFAQGQTSSLSNSRQAYSRETRSILEGFDSLFLAKDSTLEYETIGESAEKSDKYILYSKLLTTASNEELLSLLKDGREIPAMRSYAYMAYALKCDREKRKEKPLSYKFKLETLNGCIGSRMSFDEFKKHCRVRNAYDPYRKKYFTDPEEKKVIEQENKIRQEQGIIQRKE